MAEAVVDRHSDTNYFCHTCNVSIARVQEDFTCPTCGGGFVEEISNTPQHHGGNQLQDPLASLFGGGRGSFSPFDMLFRSLAEGSRSRGAGGGGRQGQTSGGGSSNFVEVHQNPGGTFTVSVGGGGGVGGGHEDEGVINPMEHMLNSFLNDLVVGLGGQQGPGHGATNMFGNLGDYVWGRDGLDAIVTQLMNQMEGTGAPPLATEKLDRLPTVKITQEQVDKKLQCSVCWDDFQLDEEVKQLDCDHLYHPPCILPWLQLHGTCPICRRDFTEGEGKGKDNEQEQRSSANSSQSSGSDFPFNVIPQAQGPPSTSNPSNTGGRNNDGNDAGSSSSTTGRGRNPRYNMDMEFD